MELDDLDSKATAAFEGYVVRKDLVRTFSRQFPVPTYVVEFLLGRYCATTDESEIQEGLEIVQKQLSSRTVKAGEENLFISRGHTSKAPSKSLTSSRPGWMPKVTRMWPRFPACA